MQRLFNFLTGLPLAIILLVAIAMYSIIGTVLPQGLSVEVYAERYPQFAPWISALQFDHVYTSFVFYVLLGLFVLNLIGCTLKIFPAQLRRLKQDYVMTPRISAEELFDSSINQEMFRSSLTKLRYSIQKTEDGFIASKHRIGHIGSSVTHLGIIVIIVGSIIGAIFAEEGFFNLMPGDVKSFPDYGFAIRLDDFYFGFRENGTVEQYYSEVSVLRSQQPEQTAKLWVNQPLSVDSLSFYQTSYGWASRVLITKNSGEEVMNIWLRKGESTFVQENHMTVYLYGFYPNFTITSEGEPLTMTEEMKNPHYAVILYEYGQHVGSYIVEPGQPIEREDFQITFQDSTLYTGLTYRKDFGYSFVVAGSAIMFLGLMFSFYFTPKQILMTTNSIKVVTRQNPWGLTYQIKKLVEASRIGKESN